MAKLISGLSVCVSLAEKARIAGLPQVPAMMPATSSYGIRYTQSPRITIGRTSAINTSAPNPSIRNPVSAIVAANLGPEAIPNLRKKYREAEVAKHKVGGQRDGPIHAARAAKVAENQRHDQHPRQSQRKFPDAGKRDRDDADHEAERHAEADGDVAELGGALD